jgi:hypothetical protein
MSTISINAAAEPINTTERSGILRARLRVIRWLTVLPLAVGMAYADGFWMISLRGAVGSIERTQEPFVTWLRESTLALPVFVLAVIGALTLAARWLGPVLRKPKTIIATALLVVAAGTLIGIAEVAASSAYDYNLQSGQVQLMQSMPSMPSMGTTAWQQQASLGLQARAVGYGSGILLVTNLALVGWVVALRGGRVDVIKPRR